MACGKTEKLTHRSLGHSGGVCSECVNGIKDARPISATTLYALQYIVCSPIEKLYTFTLKPEAVKETGKWMERYMDRYTDKRFKSLEILKIMES